MFAPSQDGYGGYFQMNASYPANMTNLAWVVFFSDPESWEAVNVATMSCMDKRLVGGTNIFPLSPYKSVSFGETEEYLLSKTVIKFINKYVRTFFLGLVNTDPSCKAGEPCDGPLMNISYTAKFDQRYEDNSDAADGEADDSSVVEASVDEQIMLALYVVLGVLFVVLVAWSSLAAHKLFAMNKLHHVYKMLMLSIQCGTIAVLCQLTHRVIMQTGINWNEEWNFIPILELERQVDARGFPSMYDELRQTLPPGVGVDWMNQDSEYFFVVSEWILLVQAMLIAKGWSIVRRKLPAQGRLRLVLGMSVYLFYAIMIQAWLLNTYNPELQTWYFGVAGNGLMVGLRAAVFVWFVVSVNHTRNKYLRKRRFFSKCVVVVLLYPSLLGSAVDGIPCVMAIACVATSAWRMGLQARRASERCAGGPGSLQLGCAAA